MVSTDPSPLAGYRSSRLVPASTFEMTTRLRPSGVQEINFESQIGFDVIRVGSEPSPLAT